MNLPRWASLALLLSSSPWPYLAAGIGLVVGSFLNVCIYRLPEGRFWHSHRSHCRHCGALIPAWLNIPVLSFLLLRGRSRCCQKPLSWQYPIVELLTGLLFLGIYLHFPFIDGGPGGRSYSALAINRPEFWRFLHASVFACLLLVASVIDIRLRLIPDKVSLLMIALTPVVVYLHPELDGRSAFYGVLGGGLSIYLIAWIYVIVRRREGIGMGDVKLLAAIGGWLGYQAVLPTLLLGSVLGSVYGVLAMLASRRVDMQAELPFGPFLAIGAMIHLLSSIPFHEFLLF